jgi:hypothetical protein
MKGGLPSSSNWYGGECEILVSPEIIVDINELNKNKVTTRDATATYLLDIICHYNY